MGHRLLFLLNHRSLSFHPARAEQRTQQPQGPTWCVFLSSLQQLNEAPPTPNLPKRGEDKQPLVSQERC